MNDKPQKQQGRPPIYAVALTDIHARLDAATIATLRKLGNGNLSKGIRKAAEIVSKK